VSHSDITGLFAHKKHRRAWLQEPSCQRSQQAHLQFLRYDSWVVHHSTIILTRSTRNVPRSDQFLTANGRLAAYSDVTNFCLTNSWYSSSGRDDYMIQRGLPFRRMAGVFSYVGIFVDVGIIHRAYSDRLVKRAGRLDPTPPNHLLNPTTWLHHAAQTSLPTTPFDEPWQFCSAKALRPDVGPAHDHESQHVGALGLRDAPLSHSYPRAMRMYPSSQVTSLHASTLPEARYIVPVAWEMHMRLSFLWRSSEQFRHGFNNQPSEAEPRISVCTRHVITARLGRIAARPGLVQPLYVRIPIAHPTVSRRGRDSLLSYCPAAIFDHPLQCCLQQPVIPAGNAFSSHPVAPRTLFLLFDSPITNQKDPHVLRASDGRNHKRFTSLEYQPQQGPSDLRLRCRSRSS
jgi:hypothetical protein